MSTSNPATRPDVAAIEDHLAYYQGQTKVQRLLFVASCDPVLRPAAYRAALHELKSRTVDVNQYLAVYEDLWHRYRNEPWCSGGKVGDGGEAGSGGLVIPPHDEAWAEATRQANRATLSRLEAELRTYRENQLSESIGLGYRDLGDASARIGDGQSAIKYYQQARLNLVDSSQLVANHLRIIEQLAATHKLWSTLNASLDHLSKLKDDSITPADSALVLAARALYRLNQGDYHGAARHLMDITAEPESLTMQILSPQDIATLVMFCSLATFSRDEHRSLLFDHPWFIPYLELNPVVFQTLNAFYNAQYREGFALLSEQLVLARLDLHLAMPLEKGLLDQIRDAMLAAYMRPFSTVRLDTMAWAFDTPESTLERRIFSLLQRPPAKGHSKRTARIDGVTKTITFNAVHPFQSSLAESEVLEEKLTQTARLIRSRVALTEAGMYISGGKRYV
ncbi:hypothetical protein IWQ60_010632 [Tieghemiomyces parasiticus]|uniref:PCI domain-containing protein n=1 Tax=Tieghemiomyces parasiticus TaxID=78921 RepID=A0A9W7ZJ95_9FUNG|nr:hypothetical protein IWQ60_010632 [Tieghemiomyces parasiticus]